MKRSNQFSLSEAIKDFLEAYNLEDKLLEQEAIQSWEKVTGTLVSNHTQRLWVKNGTLYVKVDSPAVRNELIYSRETLRLALNKAIKKDLIKEIVIR